MKVTETVLAAESVTTHVLPVTVSHPAHPAAVAFEPSVAVSVTVDPVGNAALQTFPKGDDSQLNAAGTLVTVPTAS